MPKNKSEKESQDIQICNRVRELFGENKFENYEIIAKEFNLKPSTIQKIYLKNYGV